MLAYVVLRSLMVGLYLRSYRHVPEARPLIVRYASEYSLAIAHASDPALDAGTRCALAGGAALYLACVTTAQRATAQGIRGTELARGLAIAVLAVLVAVKLWSAQRYLRGA